MPDVPGARTFAASGEAYDSFMGRYSRSLAPLFVDAAGIAVGQTVLDVGCGPGALTGVLVDRLGIESVSAFDPSPSFVDACASRFSGIDVRVGRAEDIAFGDDRFDVAMSQLVLHFVSDPIAATNEMKRVVRSGGTVAACVWDFEGEMEMLRHFWDGCLAVRPDAPDEARTLRFGRAGEVAELFTGAGLVDVEESTLEVVATYGGFDDLWNGFLAGIGPAGSYCVSLSEPDRAAVRSELSVRLGSPREPFDLRAVARMASGHVP